MNNKTQEFHTGLFLDQNKRRVLLDIVQDLLRIQYRLIAVTGPPLPNCTCEVLLRSLSLHTSEVNFANAKVLLEKYLCMIKESRPNMLFEKEPELIDLEASDDDEPMDKASVILVDLDESDVSCERRRSDMKNSPNVNLDNSEIIVVDSLRKQNLSSTSTSSTLNTDNVSKNSQDSEERFVNLDDSDVTAVNPLKSPSKLPSLSVSTSHVLNDLQDNKEKSAPIQKLGDLDIVVIDSVKGQSMRQISIPMSLSSGSDTKGVLTKPKNQANKRKRNIEKGPYKGRPIEVVEILDDDIIVVDDSFSTSIPSRLSEPELSVVEPNKVLNSRSNQPSITSRYNNEVKTWPSNTSTDSPYPESSQVSKSIPSMDESEDGNRQDKSLSSIPPKKKSKLAYHRPAHLVTPLTLPAPSNPSTKTETASNIYNPNAGTSEKRTGLRPIVIDGNNVAVSHGKGLSFSLKGIQICINYFEKRGHRHIKVFIPHYRRNRDNHSELQKMERNGRIVITPSRKVSGKTVASYDDRYIVQYAAEFGGVIVSTDNYRDLMSEDPRWRETIENRLLMFTWVDDLLMFPQDPLGRKGPSLDEFLKFPDS